MSSGNENTRVFSIPRQTLNSFLPSHRVIVEFERMIAAINDVNEGLEDVKEKVKTLEAQVSILKAR